MYTITYAYTFCVTILPDNRINVAGIRFMEVRWTLLVITIRE